MCHPGGALGNWKPSPWTSMVKFTLSQVRWGDSQYLCWVVFAYWLAVIARHTHCDRTHSDPRLQRLRKIARTRRQASRSTLSLKGRSTI
eukprot:4107269-Amphidinium_carterae.1